MTAFRPDIINLDLGMIKFYAHLFRLFEGAFFSSPFRPCIFCPVYSYLFLLKTSLAELQKQDQRNYIRIIRPFLYLFKRIIFGKGYRIRLPTLLTSDCTFQLRTLFPNAKCNFTHFFSSCSLPLNIPPHTPLLFSRSRLRYPSVQAVSNNFSEFRQTNECRRVYGTRKLFSSMITEGGANFFGQRGFFFFPRDEN